MPQSPHDRIAELHNLAGHTHFAAAVAHRKKDYATGRELSQKAHEYSADAHRQSEEMMKSGDERSVGRR